VEARKIRVLVVDDYSPWSRFLRSLLEKRPELEVVGEASDGLEAVQKAQELQPDLILLDVGLPKLSGIEAARRIRDLSSTSKILFVSEYRSWDIAEAALGAGAGGYVVKSDAGSQLLPAVNLVLEGTQFISPSLTRHHSRAPRNDHAETIAHYHEVAFYADDNSLVDGYARFIESALRIGNAVIVVVTKAHRASLASRLEAGGVNLAAAIEQGKYVLLDATETLSRLTVNDMPDPIRCAKVIGDLVTDAANSIKGGHGRVVVCGEIAPTLLSNGNAEGAIDLEHLWDEITRSYGVHTLCGYLRGASQSRKGNPIFERICAEHSAVYSQ
jgi:DNA-binding NarL/FixJ family response regulator